MRRETNDVSQIIYNAYSALYNAESDMQTSIGTFSTTFAEQEDVAGEIEIFNEMLGTIFGLVAGPMWESGRSPSGCLEDLACGC